MQELDKPEQAAALEDGAVEAEGLDENESGAALYPGDAGTLPFEARRLLVQLLSGPSLDGRRHPQLWPALLRHRRRIESRLADLFLALVMDTEAQVAFVRQADTGELETPILLRRARLTFLDSVLLLQLRQALSEAELRGERAVVSGSELIEHLKLYEGQLNTDHAGFEKRLNSALEKAKKNNLLRAIRGSEDRYEVSPTLKLLFGAEQVAALRRIYRQGLVTAGTADGGGEADGDTSGDVEE